MASASDLRIGNSVARIRFFRDGTSSQFEVLEIQGDLKIVRQPPVSSITVGMWERLSALKNGIMAA